MVGAPDLPPRGAESASDDENVAKLALIGVGGPGRADERLRGARPMQFCAETIASCGEPMGATTTG